MNPVKVRSDAVPSAYSWPPRFRLPATPNQIPSSQQENGGMTRHYHCCDWILSFLGWIRLDLSGLDAVSQLEKEDWDTMPSSGSLTQALRRCQNCKSRANPDVQCPSPATNGDYCSRHHKNPRPFRTKVGAALTGSDSSDEQSRVFTRSEHTAARKLQTFWRTAYPQRRWRLQGPAANDRSVAMNDTELYSMDPLSSIPEPYFFSMSDSRGVIWGFDIRSLVHTMGTGSPVQNPYIREEFPQKATQRLHARLDWLRRRKYQLLFLNTDQLTPEQLWNQRVLDCFLKIESLGYYVNAEWFHGLSVYDHQYFYAKLYKLWEWRLGLSEAEKESIIPGHMAAGSRRLFKFIPGEHMDRDRGWWQRTNLALLESFIGRAADKEQQKLGALYVLMSLVQASRAAAIALPWVLETVMA